MTKNLFVVFYVVRILPFRNGERKCLVGVLCGVVYIDVNIIKHSRFFYNIRIVRTVNILLKYVSYFKTKINYAYQYA